MTRIPIIRTSERRTLKRCPWRWYRTWRMGLRPKVQESPALIFGTLVHVALATWYCGPGLKRGPHPAETFKAMLDQEMMFIRTESRSKGLPGGDGTSFLIEEKMVAMDELGLVLLTEYVKFWGTDDSWSVIEPERSGQVDVPDPRNLESILAIYAFTYDLIFRDLTDGTIWLGEHKTAKAVFLDHLPMDDQAGSYWAVAEPHLRQAGLIGPKETLRGIRYNFLRKALPDERPVNSQGHATNKPIKEHYVSALLDVGVETGLDKKGKLKPLEGLTVETLAALASQQALTVVGEVSKNQPKPLFVREDVYRTPHQRTVQIRRIQNEALWMEALRSKQLPLIKNPTRDCSWDCDLYHYCQLDELGESADAEEFRRTMFKVEDPYADHRKSTEE